FARHAVPGVADLAVAAGDTDHHWRGEVINRPPACRAIIVDLFGSRVGILAELNLWHRHQPGVGHADRTPDNALFGKASIKNTPRAVLDLQSKCCRMDATFFAHVLAEDYATRI